MKRWDNCYESLYLGSSVPWKACEISLIYCFKIWKIAQPHKCGWETCTDFCKFLVFQKSLFVIIADQKIFLRKMKDIVEISKSE